MPELAPGVNPLSGQVWEHRDGGSLYIHGRLPRMVCVSRRPFGDSEARRFYMYSKTFVRKAVGRIK
jgi:hypothetical protein